MLVNHPPHRSPLAIAVRSSLVPTPKVKSDSSKQPGHQTKPIEDIQVGDLVWAWDEEKRAHVHRPVAQMFRHQGKPIVEVTVLGDDGTKQRIESTTEHPFWVEGQGWVAACKLRAGDLLKPIENNSCLRVGSVELTGVNADVFNFEVEGVHNYFVGIQGVLVHNESSREHIDLDPANSRPQIFGEGPKTSTSFMQPPSAGEAPNSGETNTVWIGRTAHGRNDRRLAVKDTRLTEQAPASSDRLIETVDEPAPNALRPRQLIENDNGIRRANSSRTPYEYPSEGKGHTDPSAEADFSSIGNVLSANLLPGDWPRLRWHETSANGANINQDLMARHMVGLDALGSRVVANADNGMGGRFNVVQGDCRVETNPTGPIAADVFGDGTFSHAYVGMQNPISPERTVTLRRYLDAADPATFLARATMSEYGAMDAIMPLSSFNRPFFGDLHMRGVTQESPFISLVGDTAHLETSTDPWARSIVYGTEHPGSAQAPHIATFSIPESLLVRPGPANSLSMKETEVVFGGETGSLLPYLDSVKMNPHYDRSAIPVKRPKY